MRVLIIILCIVLPPLAVYLHTKDVKKTVINFILSLCWLPGMIHAFYLVLQSPPPGPPAA